MALKATVCKVELAVADIDRGYYHDHALTLAAYENTLKQFHQWVRVAQADRSWTEKVCAMAAAREVSTRPSRPDANARPGRCCGLPGRAAGCPVPEGCGPFRGRAGIGGERSSLRELDLILTLGLLAPRNHR